MTTRSKPRTYTIVTADNDDINHCSGFSRTQLETEIAQLYIMCQEDGEDFDVGFDNKMFIVRDDGEILNFTDFNTEIRVTVKEN